MVSQTRPLASKESWLYDFTGNRISYAWNGATTNTVQKGANNRLHAFLRTGETIRYFDHDPQGNIVGFDGMAYAYNGFNRLASAKRAVAANNVYEPNYAYHNYPAGETKYVYNALEQRVGKSGPLGTTRFVYGGPGVRVWEMKLMNCASRVLIFLTSLLLGCAGSRGALPANVGDVDLECLIVAGAEIVPSNRSYEPTDEMTMQEQLAIANQGHTIINGNSTIIAVREFIGRNSAVDGQRYRKLTAKLDSPSSAGGSVGVSNSHFVSGSSAFVAWGIYYVSINGLKELTIVDSGPRRLLTVKQMLPVFRVPDGLKEEVEVNFECELKPKSLDQLNAWEGNATAKSDPFYP